MKKIFIPILSIGILASCGGYSEEQGKAAEDFCKCMENGETGDFDIDYAICENEIINNHNPEVMADEGYSEALKEKCPDVSSKITNADE